MGNKFKKIIAFILALFSSILAWADATSVISLDTSKQLLIITSNNWESTQGQIQRFERKDLQSDWCQVGEAIPIVLGKKGMGWSSSVPAIDLAGPKKHEGDHRTPAGIFPLGPSFGFSRSDSKFLFTNLTPTTVCIDDENSRFYNKIVDSQTILQPDWKSAEVMRKISLYEQGLVIRYNSKKVVPGAGSCIFIHNWRSPAEGTLGCVGMQKNNLTDLIRWLESSKRPMLVIVPKDEYKNVESSWSLPKYTYAE